MITKPEYLEESKKVRKEKGQNSICSIKIKKRGNIQNKSTKRKKQKEEEFSSSSSSEECETD